MFSCFSPWTITGFLLKVKKYRIWCEQTIKCCYKYQILTILRGWIKITFHQKNFKITNYNESQETKTFHCSCHGRDYLSTRPLTLANSWHAHICCSICVGCNTTRWLNSHCARSNDSYGLDFLFDLNFANSAAGLEGWRVDNLLLKIPSCTILFVIFFDWLFRVLSPYFRTITQKIRPVISLLVLFSFRFFRFLTRFKHVLVNHAFVAGVTVSILCLCCWHLS